MSPFWGPRKDITLAQAIIGSFVGLGLIALLVISLFTGCASNWKGTCPNGQVIVNGDCYTPGATYTNEISVYKK